jgi:hypothetical protein
MVLMVRDMNHELRLSAESDLAAILLADPQDSFDYAIKLLARHGLLVLISQPAEGINISFMYVFHQRSLARTHSTMAILIVGISCSETYDWSRVFLDLLKISKRPSIYVINSRSR